MSRFRKIIISIYSSQAQKKFRYRFNVNTYRVYLISSPCIICSFVNNLTRINRIIITVLVNNKRIIIIVSYTIQTSAHAKAHFVWVCIFVTYIILLLSYCWSPPNCICILVYTSTYNMRLILSGDFHRVFCLGKRAMFFFSANHEIIIIKYNINPFDSIPTS